MRGVAHLGVVSEGADKSKLEMVQLHFRAGIGVIAPGNTPLGCGVAFHREWLWGTY